MRYVSLTTEQVEQLTKLYKNSSDHRERQRAHALLLSHRHYAVPQIADLFQVDRDTVTHWMARWEQAANPPTPTSLNLKDQARSGRPATLNDDQKKAWSIG